MISLKKHNQGFTIVELLIVIVVIGILSALVLNSFAGVQARARDTERRTDINQVATQLEVYYNDNGGYPSVADLTSTTWVTDNLKGLDAQALVDPKGLALNATGSSYTYTPLAASCATNACVSFTLTADLEKSTPDPYTKKSLNQ